MNRVNYYDAHEDIFETLHDAANEGISCPEEQAAGLNSTSGLNFKGIDTSASFADIAAAVKSCWH